MDRTVDTHIKNLRKDRTVDTHIKNLRKKLEASLPDQEIFHSIYGVGYKLKLPTH